MSFALYEDIREVIDFTFRRNAQPPCRRGLKAYQNNLRGDLGYRGQEKRGLGQTERLAEMATHMFLTVRRPAEVYNKSSRCHPEGNRPHMRRYARLRKQVLGPDEMPTAISRRPRSRTF